MKIPNLLTLFRILIIVPFVALFYVETPWANWCAVGLFVLAGITDYFDGLIARLNNQVSKLGKLLDPVADKLLVCASLLMMAAKGMLGPIIYPAAVIILCREIVVSGLREFISGYGGELPVSRLSKWKTAVQMLSISFLLAVEAQKSFVFVSHLGEALLWVATLLSVITGITYVRRTLTFIIK